jgi:glycosyltransferase involved in cell wall biosynthesis
MATAGYERARAEVFERTAMVLCRSGELASRVAALGCPSDKLRIMRTVLPPIGFSRRQAPADGSWRIVQAARLVPKKGIPTALRAFARFSVQYPAAIFTIAGEGPMAEELRETASRLGIDKRVRFAGFLSQEALTALFRESHIFLQPSETVGGDVEGVPNAMLEAMAGGLPIVATRHGGIPEVVVDGETGLLCAEGDSEAIAGAMARLAGDSVLYSALAKAGADTVGETFSAGRQIANIEALYREAAGL